MAKSKSSMINSSRWQKYATVLITKELEAIAENTGVNVRLVIADKLKETYKNNVQASYMPSSVNGALTIAHNKDSNNTHKKKLTYHHHEPGFLESIDTVIEGKYVKIKINGSIAYEKPTGSGDSDGVTATEVYEYLTEGTPATYKPYPYYDQNGEVKWAKNYGMMPHPFEEHTKIQMQGFLNSLKRDISNGKYTTYRYTGKKKKRTTYGGKEIV